MHNIEIYLQEIIDHLKNSIYYLEYSYQKINNMSEFSTDKSPEDLESWESFATRFARVADIFLMKYIRAKIKLEDPAYSGTFRDHLNQAEKIGIINNINTWFKIREIRNTIAHEYSENDLPKMFEDLKKYTPILIDLKKVI